MIYILYRPNSEHERSVLELQRLLERRHIKLELIDVDTLEGISKVKTYGIMEYPSVLAVRESNGQSLQIWSGTLPTISDVEYYAWSSL
ncbi:MAG: hypothetical protein WD061_01170 [Candidatus Saccharimonadales bacterium]